MMRDRVSGSPMTRYASKKPAQSGTRRVNHGSCDRAGRRSIRYSCEIACNGPAQHENHQPAPPPHAAQIGKAGAGHHRQQQQTRPDEPGGRRDRWGAKPMAMPCLATTRPSAQQIAAAMPHRMPTVAADSPKRAVVSDTEGIPRREDGPGYRVRSHLATHARATPSHVRREGRPDAVLNPSDLKGLRRIRAGSTNVCTRRGALRRKNQIQAAPPGLVSRKTISAFLLSAPIAAAAADRGRGCSSVEGLRERSVAEPGALCGTRLPIHFRIQRSEAGFRVPC